MKSIHSCSDIHWIWASKAAPQIFQLHLCGQRAWTVCVHEFESGLTHGAQTKSTKLQTWNWIQLTYKLPGLRLQEFQIRSLLNFSKQHKDSEKKTARCKWFMSICFHGSMNESDSRIWTFRVPKRFSRKVLTRSTRWSLRTVCRNHTRNVVGTIY